MTVGRSQAMIMVAMAMTATKTTMAMNEEKHCARSIASHVPPKARSKERKK